MTNKFLRNAIPTALVGMALLMTIPVRADVEGRWKMDGNGGCFFDANDDGPNQCDPNGTPQAGRWKSDGNGGCFFDSTDSGPNQCTPTGQGPGRWKVDGNGACVFDATDDGPNQCTPPESHNPR